MESFTFNEDATHCNDLGPAADQTDPGDTGCSTHSGVLLPDVPVNIESEIKNVVQEVMGNNADVSTDKKRHMHYPLANSRQCASLRVQNKKFLYIGFSLSLSL